MPGNMAALKQKIEAGQGAKTRRMPAGTLMPPLGFPVMMGLR